MVGHGGSWWLVAKTEKIKNTDGTLLLCSLSLSFLYLSHNSIFHMMIHTRISYVEYVTLLTVDGARGIMVENF